MLFMSVTVTLIGKPGCHLCDDAKTVVDSITQDLEEVTVEEVSLHDNPLWSDLYGELIPVILVDGVEVGHWRVEPDALAQAIDQRLTAEVD
jgi:glutaredoxin